MFCAYTCAARTKSGRSIFTDTVLMSFVTLLANFPENAEL
jgi:hypothetical protein